MKKYLLKIVSMSLYVFIIFSFIVNIYAHSGRTDSNGGHRDNKNASGLGSYHYHCGGYPPHLHTNGVCPYKSNDSTNNFSSNSKTTINTNTTTTEKVKEVIAPVSIEIDQKDINIEVGEEKILTATIEPSNAEDKSVSWSSSNKDIVAVSDNGILTAIKSGTAKIVAKSSNGKIDTIEVVSKEVEKEDIVETIENNGGNNNLDTINSNNNDSSDNVATGLGVTTVLGGVGYAIYKATKKN